MTLNYYARRLRSKLGVQSSKVPIDAMFKNNPELDPNNVELTTEDGSAYQRCLLHILIDEEETKLIEFFLFESPKKADPNAVNHMNELTPIASAVQNGYFDILKLLVKGGADVDLACDNMTPCQWAASHGELEMLRYLVREAGASLTKPGDELNIYGSPMHLACLCDHDHILQYLAYETEAPDKEFNPLLMASALTNYGANTCLHVCAAQGAEKCYEVLIQFLYTCLDEDLLKKVVNKRNKQGNPPLLEAYVNESFEMVKMLLATIGELVD